MGQGREFDVVAERYQDYVSDSVRITGEGVEYFAELKAKYLVRRLQSAPRKILDYGCGVGVLSRFLQQYFPQAELHGYDVSRASLDRIGTRGFFTEDEERLAPDYDLVVLANVLHHIAPSERQSTVARLSRRLAVQGRLAVFEHNPWNAATRWAVAQCQFDEGVKLLRRAEPAGYMRAAGLELLRSEYIVFFPRMLAALRPLEPALGWLPLGGQHVTVGRKR